MREVCKCPREGWWGGIERRCQEERDRPAAENRGQVHYVGYRQVGSWCWCCRQAKQDMGGQGQVFIPSRAKTINIPSRAARDGNRACGLGSGLALNADRTLEVLFLIPFSVSIHDYPRQGSNWKPRIEYRAVISFLLFCDSVRCFLQKRTEQRTSASLLIGRS